MVSHETIQELALSFPETDEHPHFDKIAFRVRKKIFATLDKGKNRLMVMLSREDQFVFCCFDKLVIYPVPGGWGLRGATFIELGKVKQAILKDALRVAYCTTAPAKLAKKYFPR